MYRNNDKHTILVVEDNTFNICALESLFIQFNMQCESCCNGLEAIKMVKARLDQKRPMYGLILMDYSMPICNGLDATKAIRKLFLQAKVDTFICCLTAYAEKQYQVAAREAGMNYTFVKPIFKTQALKLLQMAKMI